MIYIKDFQEEVKTEIILMLQSLGLIYSEGVCALQKDSQKFPVIEIDGFETIVFNPPQKNPILKNQSEKEIYTFQITSKGKGIEFRFNREFKQRRDKGNNWTPNDSYTTEELFFFSPCHKEWIPFFPVSVKEILNYLLCKKTNAAEKF